MRVVCARRLRASCVGACACKHVRVVRVYEYVCVSMCREISGCMHTAFSIIVQFRLRDEFCIRSPGVGTIVHVITPHQFTAWGGLSLVATPTAAPQGGRGGRSMGTCLRGGPHPKENEDDHLRGVCISQPALRCLVRHSEVDLDGGVSLSV